MAYAHSSPFLDRWPARALAVVVFLLAIGSLVWLHHDALFGSETHLAANDPFVQCMNERTADLDRMSRDGTITAEQSKLFRSRLDGVCRAQIAAR